MFSCRRGDEAGKSKADTPEASYADTLTPLMFLKKRRRSDEGKTHRRKSDFSEPTAVSNRTHGCFFYYIQPNKPGLKNPFQKGFNSMGVFEIKQNLLNLLDLLYKNLSAEEKSCRSFVCFFESRTLLLTG